MRQYINRHRGKHVRLFHALIRAVTAPPIRSPLVRGVASGLLLGIAATASAADTTLLNVSYDPTREFYEAFNTAFIAHWKAETGEEVAAIQTSFPAEGLLRQDNFVSLLYYLGLLSFAGEREGRPLLRIPNRTVRQLMYGYLRDAYDEVGVFRPSTYEIADRLNKMAYRGEWRGFFDYLAEEIGRQASVRDFLQGEKMIQGFLLAWLNLSPYFQVFSEAEQAGGFVDLYLAPFYFGYPDMRHAYLIELKYLSRAEDSPARREHLLAEARAQLRRYATDARVQDALGAATLHPIVLLYSGWELVHREAL